MRLVLAGPVDRADELLRHHPLDPLASPDRVGLGGEVVEALVHVPEAGVLAPGVLGELAGEAAELLPLLDGLLDDVLVLERIRPHATPQGVHGDSHLAVVAEIVRTTRIPDEGTVRAVGDRVIGGHVAPVDLVRTAELNPTICVTHFNPLS